MCNIGKASKRADGSRCRASFSDERILSHGNIDSLKGEQQVYNEENMANWFHR